jgi:hypothetical protein
MNNGLAKKKEYVKIFKNTYQADIIKECTPLEYGSQLINNISDFNNKCCSLKFTLVFFYSIDPHHLLSPEWNEVAKKLLKLK